MHVHRHLAHSNELFHPLLFTHGYLSSFMMPQWHLCGDVISKCPGSWPLDLLFYYKNYHFLEDMGKRVWQNSKEILCEWQMLETEHPWGKCVPQTHWALKDLWIKALTHTNLPGLVIMLWAQWHLGHMNGSISNPYRNGQSHKLHWPFPVDPQSGQGWSLTLCLFQPLDTMISVHVEVCSCPLWGINRCWNWCC